MIKQIGIGLLILVLVLVLAFGLEWLGIGWKGFFGPKHEDVKREVWEQTKSRVEGAVQEISKRRLEYIRSNDEIEKKAIAEYIRSSYANLDPEDINDPAIRRFFINCKDGKY